jgi:transketolase
VVFKGESGMIEKDLKAKAHWVWRETLKIHKIAPETRIASSLSPIEIFVALYYGGVLKFNAKAPLDEARDRFIISKGHGSICFYPILADLGFFDKSELAKVCQEGSFLGGIPDPVIPGYETVNGSLGHGLGVAAGIALAQKRSQKNKDVFVLVGDGELHEGANWEAAMFAAQHQLDNLTLIIDNNKISMLDFTDKIVSHGDLVARFTAFGWDAVSVDGHDVEGVRDALLKQKEARDGKPKVLVANTIKGHGVPGLENESLSHIFSVKPEKIDELLEANP